MDRVRLKNESRGWRARDTVTAALRVHDIALNFVFKRMTAIPIECP